MNNFNYTDDTATVERLSEQRDAIYDHVVTQFRVHMANDDIDSAMALADEFYEWMDPEQLEDEPTFFVNEHELQQLFIERTE
jgi:hypothetical protein|tara:strand:- start:371 stop:616 length:246 start_codon:yes stop_codon:yes gene_type:complete